MAERELRRGGGGRGPGGRGLRGAARRRRARGGAGGAGAGGRRVLASTRACPRRRCCARASCWPRCGAFPGVREAVTGDLDVGAVLDAARRGHPRPRRLGNGALARDHGITLVRGHARFDGERRLSVGDDVLVARRAVVVATGSGAAVPPIDGLREARPWTNREATTAKRGARAPGDPRRRRGGRGDGAGLEHARVAGHAGRGARTG